MRSLLALAATILAALTIPAAASAAGPCTTAASPGANLQAFVDTLTAGSTGCLHGGSYTATSLRFSNAGTPSAPIELASYPGERATIAIQYVYVVKGATDVHLDSLSIAGQPYGGITLQLDGDRVQLTSSDVTNSHQAESCVNLGFYPIVGPVVAGNYIHDCGEASNGNHDHGIYAEGVSGSGEIAANVLERNCCGWQIQLWPGASDLDIHHNTLRADPGASEGGVIVSAGNQSHRNVIRRNVLVGNGTPYVFDTYQLPADGAIATGNCIDPNGAPLWEADGGAAVQDGGGNVIVTDESECAASPTATPTATATADPTETPTPTPTPTATPDTWVEITSPGPVVTTNYICPTADASAGTTWVRFTLDATKTYTDTAAPWLGTCWNKLTRGTHTLRAGTSTGASDTVTFIR